MSERNRGGEKSSPFLIFGGSLCSIDLTAGLWIGLFGSMLLRVRADVAALGLPLMETSRVSALAIPTRDRQGSFTRTD